ncbi:MAG: hypothetical protein JO071_11845, partial [Deltaproteobacteria bacterium]|nr:hypothetical protein [Deltaproteobacteria bacterium]
MSKDSENKQNDDQSQPHQSPASKDIHRSDVLMPPPSNVERTPATKATNNDQHSSKEEEYWDRQVFWQRLTTIFTGFAFLAASVYAYFAFQQVDMMQKTLQQTIRVADAAATQAAALPTQISELEEANRVTRDNFRIEQRPYIWITNV